MPPMAPLLKVRPLGSTGAFVCPNTGKSLGVIRSIVCNADGTRVSILSDQVHGQVHKGVIVRSWVVV